jgi:hypothetical protein
LAACGDVKRLLMDKAWNIARENVSSKIDVWVWASLNLVLWLWYWYEFLADNGLWVSAQMLKTFMYWDGSFQQYWKWDLIYDKVKNSKVYQEQLNMALIEIRKEWRYYNYWSNSFYSSSDRDLIYSIWLFDWEMGWRLNSNWLIETEFIMNDTYDFKINDYSSIVWWTLNNMWYWYQERNLWTIYEWELRISEIIK